VVTISSAREQEEGKGLSFAKNTRERKYACWPKVVKRKFCWEESVIGMVYGYDSGRKTLSMFRPSVEVRLKSP
jgi:hypothetical protein